MKYDKFFELAKKAGIEDAELYISQAYSLSFSLFHKEVVNYQNNNSFAISARGIYKGKLGTASCDVWNAEKAEYLVNEIVENAKVIENNDPAIIFEGSPKYKKVKTFNPELQNISIEEKLNKLYELEDAIKAYDKRIVEAQEVEYSEEMNSVTLINSRGLKLVDKGNYFVFVGVALAKDGDQTKSGYEILLDNDFTKADMQELAKKIGETTINQLGGEPPLSGKYKAVLDSSVVSSLMSAYLSSASAEEVQKNSSLLIGKLNTKIASSKVTIEDRPLQKTVFARWFDDEGVATSNKTIVKNGVLQTYLYNLTTAAKEGRETTGNGFKAGGKIGIATTFLTMKPGKKSLDELYEDVKDGVYITEVSGLHAGLNPQSGNFSLQSTGFLIKDGKRDRALDIITVTGNLMDVFKDVTCVGSDYKVFPSGTGCSSVEIKKIVVGGK